MAGGPFLMQNVHRSLVEATHAYESWAGSQLRFIKPDLAEKHRRMAESPFALMRSTFYRWVPLWQATCADLTHAPLYDADLTGADLTGADLDGADLTGAKLGPDPRWVPPGWIVTDPKTGELGRPAGSLPAAWLTGAADPISHSEASLPPTPST